ncbi:MAG: molybdenum cofactor biosynthesis protein A [Candidatus Methanofastidiosum methylothiophilum]|uniref:Molybdenum cofactor biosynthesis protein A n=1 Tax=Candidatus Methanofastidiosum methylothiophilum TaxID=1705564 RepID=A0A150IK37_9EURY|nr:MAG: molybdenum cofactor biosynthesis protein A [Candidatus Methanofastidiosum methylthiophilus]
MKNPAWEKVGSKYAHITMAHPCFNEKSHFTVGRIHLPVAPKCNIQCNYCTRSINKCEFRPGVSACIMSPKDALERLEKALKETENLKVVGIAGPGESLANDSTFETLTLIDEKYPDLIKCLSTNGLFLKEKARELADLGVKTVTVTVNALDEEITEKVYSWINIDNKIVKGKEAARKLIERQWEGILAAKRADMLVKINTVLIPEINLYEIEKIALKGRDYGADLMNLIPLIPLNKFKDLRPPTCDEISGAREKAGKYLQQFKLCRQCRADAVGIPGHDSDYHKPCYA